MAVIAIRHGGEPQVNPDPAYRFAPGDDIFLIGTEGALAEFERSL